jgi:hypothetical protein
MKRLLGVVGAILLLGVFLAPPRVMEALAQQGTETFSNFVLGAPTESPVTGFEVIPCIIGGVTKQCLASSLGGGGGGGSVTWPTSGDIVISNSSNSPAGLPPVNGNCVVGVGSAWTSGPCGTSAYPTSPVIVGSGNNMASVGQAIYWNKSVGSASAAGIPTCSSGIAGQMIAEIDEKGDAAANNITITPLSGTILGQPAFVMNSGFESAVLQCDGVSNWVIL